MASLNPFGKAAGADTNTRFASSSNATGEKRDWLSGPKKLASGATSWMRRPSTAIPGDENDPVSLASKAEVNSEVFVANGRLWESTGNYEKAMESYAKALEKSPNDPAALANIARLHFRQKNHQKAAEYFGKAIEQKPEDAGLFNDLGLTLSKLGNHSAATAALNRALMLDPKSSRYANNLASVKFEAGDKPGALEVLVKNNRPAVAHFNMAYLHYKHNQHRDSVHHLNQALQSGDSAPNDIATKRAMERSRELLAQLGGMAEPGTMIAAAPQKPAEAAAAPPATNPPLPGTPIKGFENLVRPASGNPGVPFNKATFPMPEKGKEVNQTSATGFSLPPGMN
ncbi:MAG: tetratricopeptide repeat protein [Planctomycetota bacterium]